MGAYISSECAFLRQGGRRKKRVKTRIWSPQMKRRRLLIVSRAFAMMVTAYALASTMAWFEMPLSVRQELQSRN